MHPSHLIVTSPPDSRPLRATLQASFHRILWSLRVRGDDPPKAAPVIFGGVLKEGTSPLARRLLQDQMIWEIVQSQAPNKVLWSVPPTVDPAEQLLPRSYWSALSLLLSGYCSLLSVDWADDPTCPDCHATDLTVTYLFSCPTHPTDLAPGDVWTAPLQVNQFLAGLPQFSDLLTSLQVNFDPPLNHHSSRCPSPLAVPAGPIHLSSSLIFLFHLIDPPPPPLTYPTTTSL